MKTKKKVIYFEVTQKMCDEFNELEERLFGKYSEEVKKAIGVKEVKPQRIKILFG